MTSAAPRILLMGSGEFTPAVLPVDTMLRDTMHVHSVAVIPAAAGKEPDAMKWITMAEHHYASLGIDITGIPAFTPEEANSTAWDSALANVDLIYLSGGDPTYLHSILAGSRLWTTILSRVHTGVILAGSSAGAMVLGSSIPKNIRAPSINATPPEWVPAFLLVRLTIFPHFDRWQDASHRLNLLTEAGPPSWMGIDEDTGVFVTGDHALVVGRSSIELHEKDKPTIYHAGDTFTLPVNMLE
ncbi:MAG: Type 1 glutamine amidotransferase-like domain-containing protein [Candidatus Dormibacteria bacterium]